MRHVDVVHTMGTVVSVDVRTPAEPDRVTQAVGAVGTRLRQIDGVFSAWRADSWVSSLIEGTVTLADCPREVRDVVGLALDLMEATDGFFSPFWRRLPYGEPGPDPTGLVKGWAAQQASDVLVRHGLGDHIVNAAGDLVVSGSPTPGDPAAAWHVGISHPRRPHTRMGFVELDQTSPRWAVATSGTAENGAHVSDPHTGRFPCSVVSATVVTRVAEGAHGGAAADAWATALVAAGGTASSLLRRLATEGAAGFLVAADASVTDPGHLLRRA
jgi:thiamine biosynthesis lipoprotein